MNSVRSKDTKFEISNTIEIPLDLKDVRINKFKFEARTQLVSRLTIIAHFY